MTLKPKKPEGRPNPEKSREPESYQETNKVRKKVGSALAKKSRATEKPDSDEDAMILEELERLAESDTVPEDFNLEAPLSEIDPLPERLLSIESGPKGPIPAEIAAIIGKHGTFWKAMEDEKAFKAFTKALPKLKKTIHPDLLSEMLVISAEQSYEVSSFIQHDAFTRKAHTSWKETASDPAAFFDLMQGGWLTQIVWNLKPKEAVTEILIFAAKVSKANAQLILGKAKRDAEGGPVLENTEYNLSDLLGKEAFDQVIAVARETIGLKESKAVKS
jgi:hypothetical protein